MSKVKKGDRVRVILEDDVAAADVSGRLSLGSGLVVNLGDGRTISIEKIPPPLPTTPGSVIRIGNIFLGLRTNGAWASFSNYVYVPERLAAASSDVTVVYDAGKGS